MDQDLAALAAAGSRTIVSLMLTDAWTGAKQVVTRLFASGRDTTPAQVSTELDTSRNELQSTHSIDRPSIEQAIQNHLNANLLHRLEQQPELTTLVAEIIAYAREQNITTAPSADAVSIRARASGNARVYQQGHGIQHNG